MAKIATEFVTAAAALAPVLELFDSLAGRPLSGVWLRHEHGCLTEAALDFGGIFLAAVAEEDFDTLKLEISARPSLTEFVDSNEMVPWSAYIGRQFSWGWLTMNQQGYVDGVLLGFGDDICPKILLNVIASEIKVGAITF